MKVSVTVDFTDADRRNVARFHGHDGHASHIQCKAWAQHQVRGSLAVMATAATRPLPTVPKNRLVREGDLVRRSS